MNRWIVMCTAVVLLSGCLSGSGQSLYEVRLTSGERLYAKNKPSLNDDYYVFDDVNQQEYRINRSLVLYVEPAKFER